MCKLVKHVVVMMCILVYAGVAEAACGDKVGRIQVNVAKDLGRVVYDHSKPRSRFEEAAGAIGKSVMTKDTAGATVVNLQIEGTTEVEVEKVKGGWCVVPQSINVQMFYNDILVLIDSKYPVGSCEYNSIISHENKHVNVARLVIDFYSPYVKKELEKFAETMRSVKVNDPFAANTVVRRYNREVGKALAPMIELINEQLEKGNAKLDTPDAYRKDTARCKNW